MRGEFVEVSGARLYYYAAGTRGKGEPLILLHGFPASAHLWRDVVPELPKGHRVVVLDLLGYGRSDRPDGRALSIAAHAARVIELADALRITRFAVAGHDLGGGVAQHLAVHQPERVARLALVSSVGFDAWPPRELKLARSAIPFMRKMPPKPVINQLRRALRKAYEEEERGARSVEMYLRPFEGPGGKDALIAHVAALDEGETTALAPRLKEIAVPTAVIWGGDDPFIAPAVGKRLQKAIPGATLDLLPDVMHYPPETAPESVAEILTQWFDR
jgi:pimeloyl-ACP methyl ester carboxylesterase